MLQLADLVFLSKPELRDRRIRLMRHAFRGGKDDIQKVQKWTKNRVVLDPAGPEAEGLPSARDILNRVRFNPRLVELVSAEQGDAVLRTDDLLLTFAATGGRSAEYLGAFDVRGTLEWEDFYERYAEHLEEPPAAAVAKGMTGRLVKGLGYNSLPAPGKVQFDLRPRQDVLPGLQRRLIVE